MRPSVFRLVLAASLFVAWLCYLGYLVATRPVTASGWPLVVSRPQILSSEIDLVVEIDAVDEPVTVKQVLWPQDAPLKEGDRVRIGRLGECRPLLPRGDQKPPADVSGPGLYLVPLRRSPEGKGKYEVAPIPPSPGFHAGDLPVRVYPATGEALAQYRQVEKPG